MEMPTCLLRHCHVTGQCSLRPHPLAESHQLRRPVPILATTTASRTGAVLPMTRLIQSLPSDHDIQVRFGEAVTLRHSLSTYQIDTLTVGGATNRRRNNA